MIQEMRKRIKWGRAGKKRMLTVETVSTLVRMTGCGCPVDTSRSEATTEAGAEILTRGSFKSIYRKL